MYAVWKSKHMVRLAKFQTSSKVFSGLFIPYQDPSAKVLLAKKVHVAKKSTVQAPVQVKTAVLGGGDIAFPLVFSAVVMEHLVLDNGLSKAVALSESLVLPVVVSACLFWLLMKAKKDTFYPAMPFLSIGCFVGYAIIALF